MKLFAYWKTMPIDGGHRCRNISKVLLIMKLTAFIILTSCLQISARGFSQEITLSEKKAPLQKVLQEIKRQSGYTVVYQDQLLRKSNPVDIDVKGIPLEQALTLIFAHQPMTYEILGKKVIVVKEREPAPAGPPPPGPPVADSISGTVTNEKGEPMAGVTVVLKGTTEKSVITDEAGRYFFSHADSKATLQFSYVGYGVVRRIVGTEHVLHIVLEQVNGRLNQVVVVGYGSQRTVDVTGSISTITSKDLTQNPVVDVTNALAGRLPGLISMQQSGEPGYSNSTLNIRGFGTPLLIIDGVESSLVNLDPNEIASISILKDASAAIYGARAGNGVILVTTKRGASGKPTVSLSSTYSFQTVTAFPKPLNAGQYAELINEAEVNSGTPTSGLRFTADQVQKYKLGTDPAYKSTNWFDAVMNKSSPLLQEGLSVTGGSDAIKYYTFLGYTGQTGMYKSGDNTFRRFNLRSNIDGRISRNLTISLDIAGSISTTHSPTRPQTNLWQDFYELEPTFPAFLPDPARIAYGGTVASTIASTTRSLGGYNDQGGDQLFTTLTGKYTIPGVRGLTLKGMVNYLQNTTETKTWTKAYTMYTYDPTSQAYTPWSSAAITQLTESYDKSRTITAQGSLNYDRVFNGSHHLGALALVEVSDYSENTFSAARTGYITTAIDQLFAGSGDGQSANGSASQTGRISYVGRVNYAFKEKYLLESTLRYDGSPNFPSNKRWGLFPSVSAGWRINEESFFKDHVSWVDNLKLRASASQTGFDGIGAYQYLTGFQFGNTYIANNTIKQGLISTGLANPDITWERMTIYNLGLDFSMKNGSVYGTIEAFFRDRDKILASPIGNLPNTFGATLPLENINSQNNRGIEISLGHKGKIGKVTYDVTGNVSYARAKWVHYAEPDYTDPDDIRVHKLSGKWTDQVLGYKANGLFTSAQEVSAYTLNQDQQNNATLMPGDIKYVDHNGDGILDWRDQQVIGHANQPLVMFGLSFTIQYNRFSLYALLQGAAAYSDLLSFGVENFSNQKDVVYEDRWTEKNDNPNALIPRQYMGGKVNNTYASTYWLKNASYGRLKSLNFGYELPQAPLRKIGFNGARLYFAGANLFTISGLLKYNIDPEAPSGIKGGNYYPQQKVYSLGLLVSF